MIGAIRTWDIVSHPVVTVQCFGWRTLFRAMIARKDRTFLSLLNQGALISPADPDAAAILRQCVDLELRAENIYITLGNIMIDQPPLALFFTTLAEQEQEHADLLRLCAAASKRDEAWLRVLRSWRDDVIRLSQRMSEAEDMLPTVGSVEDAMRLLVQIELSEVNQVFLGAMKASNAAFVKKLRPFEKAVEAHLFYIGEQLPKLAPSLCCEEEADENCCQCLVECGAV
jgi:hypothetical protein